MGLSVKVQNNVKFESTKFTQDGLVNTNVLHAIKHITPKCSHYLHVPCLASCGISLLHNASVASKSTQGT